MLFLRGVLNADFGQNLFGVQREVAGHNPSVIAWIFFKHVSDKMPFVFTEIEYLFVIVIVYDASGEIYVVGVA